MPTLHRISGSGFQEFIAARQFRLPAAMLARIETNE
jgi:hypothetical protein